jgi:predicted anti-sigma-YlaC factor YlaD
MNKPECDRLDDYLLGWLSEEQAAAFEGHLADCAECRGHRETQCRIDRAMETARTQPESVPPLLVERIHRQVRAARAWRLVRIACGLAAAALLTVLPGRSWFAGHRCDLQPDTELVAHSQPLPPPIAVAVEQPRIRLVDPFSAILVPMPSKNPEVTIVWVYPTVKPGQ